MKIRERQAQEEHRIQQLELMLAVHNSTPKQTIDPQTAVRAIVEPYRRYFVADIEKFQLKTKSSSREKQLLELVRYVFCKYRVSPSLTRVWVRKISDRRFYGWDVLENGTKLTLNEDPILWFLCVAQGGSLYKTYSKKYLTKAETHTLITSPHDLSFEQTLVFATAKTFAEKEGTALRLAHSKLSTLNFTEFIKTVIYFFAKNPPKSLDEVNDLTDFILARYNADNKWSLAGRTLDSLRVKCHDWHFELRRAKVLGNFNWEGAPIPDGSLQTGPENHPIKWFFTQIRSSKVLAQEGTDMRHCVYGYKDMCLRNQTYIWSLSREEFGARSKKVTLELRNNGHIVQARGVANRPMKPDERHVVGLWAKEHNLLLMC